MANFPTTLPSFSNPSASNYLNSPAHATQHANVNDELVAVATKVGADNSAVNTTHDYKLSSVADGQKAVSTSGDQTISGKKTFLSPVGTWVTATDGSTITFDLATGNLQKVTLGGNRTLAVSNATIGQAFIVKLIQDGTGSRTVTWFSTINWAGGVTPTLTTTASKADVFGFICTAADTFDGFIVGQGLAV